MKILSVEQIREADRYTIENEPIESVDLMERAATKVFEWLYRRAPREKTIKIFCGMGTVPRLRSAAPAVDLPRMKKNS